ncbi:MAG: hypothetical protein HY081_09495 [Gammaproteobacteria bacterium]|nr:hypothetical protein [Gammaproteobacteria bacterium]
MRCYFGFVQRFKLLQSSGLFLALTLACLSLSCTSLATQNDNASATTYYISPTGSNWNNGKSSAAPFKSFEHAFNKMSAGDELVLLDGTYSEAADTGYIGYTDYSTHSGGAHTDQIPSGLSAARPTYVHAQNPGKVTVVGQLFIGRSFRKDSFIKIQGITFEGGGSLFNANYVTIKDCGFHGSFGIGSNDHDQGSDYNLIEDVWVWAAGVRIVAINYRSRFNVWRRVLVRGDGCNRSECRGGGNPNVGITVYDSSNISLQNVMVVDRILAKGDDPYADFAVAQHTPGAYLFGKNEWLGTLSLRAPDTGYYMEPDREGTIDPTIRIVNAIAWDSAELGFNLRRAGTNNFLENLTVRALGGDGVRVAPELDSGILRNVISVNAERYGINSNYVPSYVNVFNAKLGPYRQTTCSVGCYALNPLAGENPPLKYLVRIEPHSFLKAKGFQGADIGANLLYRYGADGARYGETGFNILSTVPLWPWPNEKRIKEEMCQRVQVTRGFCQKQSLTHYIWEYLGHPMPANPYQPVAATEKKNKN